MYKRLCSALRAYRIRIARNNPELTCAEALSDKTIYEVAEAFQNEPPKGLDDVTSLVLYGVANKTTVQEIFAVIQNTWNRYGKNYTPAEADRTMLDFLQFGSVLIQASRYLRGFENRVHPITRIALRAALKTCADIYQLLNREREEKFGNK